MQHRVMHLLNVPLPSQNGSLPSLPGSRGQAHCSDGGHGTTVRRGDPPRAPDVQAMPRSPATWEPATPPACCCEEDPQKHRHHRGLLIPAPLIPEMMTASGLGFSRLYCRTFRVIQTRSLGILYSLPAEGAGTLPPPRGAALPSPAALHGFPTKRTQTGEIFPPSGDRHPRAGERDSRRPRPCERPEGKPPSLGTRAVGIRPALRHGAGPTPPSLAPGASGNRCGRPRPRGVADAATTARREPPPPPRSMPSSAQPGAAIGQPF